MVLNKYPSMNNSSSHNMSLNDKIFVNKITVAEDGEKSEIFKNNS